MLDLDPPDHTRLRALVHRAFTPRLVEQMRGRIQSLADELLVAAGRRGNMDLIRDYALPIPTTIIAEMLGVPDADRHRFHRWSRSIVSATPSGWGMLKAIPSAVAFLRYIRRLVASRRAHPRDDLVGALVQAEEAGEQLSEDELVAMVFLLLVAGHETTVNLIGNGTLALLMNPAQMERLKDDPTLIKSAVEELLRYESPLETATERYAREDVTVAGVTIPRGELVYAALASANRDERQFPDPDVLDITPRAEPAPVVRARPALLPGCPARPAGGAGRHRHPPASPPGLRLAVDPESLRWRRGLVLAGSRHCRWLSRTLRARTKAALGDSCRAGRSVRAARAAGFRTTMAGRRCGAPTPRYHRVYRQEYLLHRTAGDPSSPQGES